MPEVFVCKGMQDEGNCINIDAIYDQNKGVVPESTWYVCGGLLIAYLPEFTSACRTKATHEQKIGC